jgi:hypothetical protein
MLADPDSVAMLAAARSQATAAWVQAWGSIAAIFAAGLFAVGLEGHKRRARRKEWLSNLVALSLEVKDMAQGVAKAYASKGSLYETQMTGDSEEYAPVVEALASFPSYALTDRLHLVALLHLRRFAATSDRLWRAAVAKGEDMHRHWDAEVQAKAMADETAAFAAEVARFK